VYKRRIAVNSVINCSFFYYICCFSIFLSNFIVSGSGVPICNAHATTSSSRPFEFDSPYPISYRYSIATKSLSPVIFAILGPEHIGVTALTFLGHVTSSVTWLFDSQIAISHRCSIVTKCLSPAVFEIMGITHNGVTPSTFLGHMTSSVTWPFDSALAISYWWSFGTKSLSLTVS